MSAPRGTPPEPDARDADICLVSMPYAALLRPSLALSLLKAILAADGLEARVLYANLAFAERMGVGEYYLLERLPRAFLSGEWTFAAAAFGERPDRDAEYLRLVAAAANGLPEYIGVPELLATLGDLRDAAEELVDDTARQALATGARIVGATSTFEQHAASLALLRRVHELDPGVVTMLGGANCETVMGAATHRCFPWVDYVVSGEADGLIGGLCREVLDRGRDIPADKLAVGVLGPCHREPVDPSQLARASRRALYRDLDDLPLGEFDDYFAALDASKLRPSISPALPLESSRGCWWGARHQCTFCGLNGSSLGYRSKSADRVLAELHALEDRYGITDFEAVDNILDAKYLRTLLPRMARDGRRRRVFYEVKANLTRAQVRQLVEAGVTWVQPGIESLHSGVLALMDKGVRGWQNVQLLRYAREFGMRMSWTVMCCFPGEEDAWYREMAGWMPALEHLEAPQALTRLRYDRYSVYHDQATARGLDLRAVTAMGYVYPVAEDDLEDLAYFFAIRGSEPNGGGEHGLIPRIASGDGLVAAREAVAHWRESFRKTLPPVLAMRDRERDGEPELEIVDTRSCATRSRWRLTGLARDVVLACDRAPMADRLGSVLELEHGAGALEDTVHELCAARLLLAIDERLVSLPVAGDLPSLPESSEFPGGHINRSLLPDRRPAAFSPV